MWAIFHPAYLVQRWHVFIIYEIFTVLCFSVTIFCNRALPMIQLIGGWLTVGGCVVTVVVCLVMARGRYATDEAVWVEWTNGVGWSSNGFVFCLGMLNGAFSVGVPDLVAHMAEEVPRYV